MENPLLNYKTPQPPDDPSMKWQLKKLKTLAIGVVGAALVVGSVWYLSASRVIRATRPQGPPPTSATAPATHPAAWQLPQAQRDRLVAAINALKLDEDKQAVLDSVGQPDRDRVLVPKGVTVQAAHGSAMTYDFVTYEIELVNEKWDQRVTLSFDTAGRLKFIESGVPEVATRGAPIRRSPE
jgi:hypothetical protein